MFTYFGYCQLFSHNIIYLIFCCSYKYNRSKIFTPTLKKPVLSSSENQTSYTTSLSQTVISSRLENKYSTAIQNTSEISNTGDIHSCVTPLKKIQCWSKYFRSIIFVRTTNILVHGANDY